MTGYRPLPTSDPREQELRDRWHQTKADAESGEPGAAHLHAVADAALARYLWDRTQAEIAADRKKHPKARRNQTFQGTPGQGRNLP